VSLPVLRLSNARLNCADPDGMGVCQLISSVCGSGQAEISVALRHTPLIPVRIFTLLQGLTAHTPSAYCLTKRPNLQSSAEQYGRSY